MNVVDVTFTGLFVLAVLCVCFALPFLVHREVLNAPDPEWELTCPSCGRPVKPGQTLCYVCGSELPVAARRV